MSYKKVLITADVHPYLSERLIELGFSVNTIEDISREELLEIIPSYSILIITTYLKADRELLDKGVNLKIIGRVGSGMENVNTEYAKQKNILCFNSPEGNANAVGEHTLGLLLNILHNIHAAAEQMKRGLWLREENRGIELSGKTVGIIGFGHTGTAFAKKLAGFNVRILAFDPYKTIEAKNIEQCDLQDLQNEAHVISFHVPYTEETHHFINADFIAGCKKHPVILNTSRGQVADTAAVLRGLENKQLSGFGADVYEDEPLDIQNPVISRLLGFKNVVATPHIGGWTVESKYLLVKTLMDKIEPYLAF